MATSVIDSLDKCNQVIVALGSNLGNSKQTLESAVKKLSTEPGINQIRCSSWYQTPPIGPPQPNYYNGCVWLSCQGYTPYRLLQCLQSIETSYGRERNVRWGARTLDLDIIFFDDQLINQQNLTIPHPRMQERAFVLVPLAEIAPNWIDPRSGKSVTELCEHIDCDDIVQIKAFETTSN